MHYIEFKECRDIINNYSWRLWEHVKEQPINESMLEKIELWAVIYNPIRCC